MRHEHRRPAQSVATSDWRDLQHRDPITVAKTLTMPMPIVPRGRAIQTSPRTDIAQWAKTHS